VPAHGPAPGVELSSTMAEATALTQLSACAAVELLRAGEVSPLELIDAALERIERTDGAINALPTLCPERARSRAARMEGVPPEGRGALAGLPIAVKDLTDVAGVRTTYGSPAFADNVPDSSDLLVERLEGHGAVVLAKSNTPEFGAGANTFNPVLGVTRNPWDTRLTCAGSSGGSAAALAAGQVWLATGSDLGGSLRTPASFCSVVGIRPSPGRVPSAPGDLPFDTLSVEGPMGRTVADAALMLDAMAGPHPDVPLALPAPQTPFLAAATAPQAPHRVAFSPDLGITPVDAEVAAVCRAAALRCEPLGGSVEEDHPDLREAPEAFRLLRAVQFAASLGPLVEEHPGVLKPEIEGNVELGRSLSGHHVAWAERSRGALTARTRAFFEHYDLLICPAACAQPFPVETRWLNQLGGYRFEHYVDWLRLTSAITLVGCPVVALPGGFTAAGLPVGLQLVGRPGGEHRLLAAAAALEAELGIAGRVPIDPRPG